MCYVPVILRLRRQRQATWNSLVRQRSRMGELRVQGDPASKNEVDMMETYTSTFLPHFHVGEVGKRERVTAQHFYHPKKPGRSF